MTTAKTNSPAETSEGSKIGPASFGLTDAEAEALVITITDIVQIHCARGTKKFFDERDGFNFRDIMKHGVSAKALIETGDARALQVVASKVERLRG